MREADGGCGHPAAKFLHLLGKDPIQTYFRTIRQGKGANSSRRGKDLQGLDLEALSRDNQAGEGIYFVTGNSTTASGPAGGVAAKDITSCPALFVEWDDKPKEWQLQAWQELGLPKPSTQLLTGGKSVHSYWLLTEAMETAQWRELQARLIDHCGSDQQCKDPSRVMRLPGFAYIDKKTGKPNGHTAEVVHTSYSRYSAAEIEACLPSLLPEPPSPVDHSSTAPAQGDAVPLVELLPRNINQLATQGATEGSRNSDAFTIAASAVAIAAAAAAAGLRIDGTPEAVVLDFAARCSPPMDQREALGRLQSAESQPRTPDAGWPDRLRFQLNRSHKPKRQQQANQKTDPAIIPASFQDLIQELPDGWRETEIGIKPRKISVGEMARLIEGKKGELLRFNEMTMYVEAKTIHGWQVVNDAAMDSGYVLLDQKGWIIGLESVIKAVCHVARQRSTHPVREYLLKIEQDASIEPYNLDKVGPVMFRAKQSLHSAMVRKWLVGAVGRVLSPGCQMDYCLVLHSRQQGMLKSSALTELASGEWHTSTIPNDNKDFLLNVHCTWIYELAELESYTNKRAAGELKNTITTRTDNFRVPYGRTNERRKRPSVFCGSVNTDSFLRDETGSRRYWVVPIEGNEKLNIDAIKKNRDSIWKAALMAYRSGEKPMLSDEHEALSERQNDGFQAQDAWLEMLQSWMAGYALARFCDSDPSPRMYEVDGYYTSAEILYSAGLKRPDQINNHDATRLGPLLRELGFSSKRVTDGASKIRRWTTWTTPDHPETVSGGPGSPIAPEAISDLGPPRPPEKVKRQQEKKELGTQLAQGITTLPLLGTSGGPHLSSPESTSVCSRSDRTTSTSDSGGHSGGPRPISTVSLATTGKPAHRAPTTAAEWVKAMTPTTPTPTWLPQLLAIRSANPGQPPSVYANDLMAQHGITTDGRTVKALLSAWDEHQPAA